MTHLEQSPAMAGRWINPAARSRDDSLPRLTLDDLSLLTFHTLNIAHRQALRVPDFDWRRDRYIIFSDTHKGDKRRGADEFQRNAALYGHALSHYLDGDFRLILNGDIEEGWKARYADIFATYRETAFALEREFAQRGSSYYRRTFGNHDQDWADPRYVEALLSPALGRSVRVHPAILLGDHIMIAHGHQGDLRSDRLAWLSRRFVRYLWKPFQRIFNYAPRQLAENHTSPLKRDRHLSAWARTRRLLLIAGHTHQPVMQVPARTGQRPAPGTPSPAHYINNGCCVHDRSLTGIEITEGNIRLVRWDAPEATQAAPRRTVLQATELWRYFAAL